MREVKLADAPTGARLRDRFGGAWTRVDGAARHHIGNGWVTWPASSSSLGFAKAEEEAGPFTLDPEQPEDEDEPDDAAGLRRRLDALGERFGRALVERDAANAEVERLRAAILVGPWAQLQVANAERAAAVLRADELLRERDHANTERDMAVKLERKRREERNAASADRENLVRRCDALRRERGEALLDRDVHAVALTEVAGILGDSLPLAETQSAAEMARRLVNRLAEAEAIRLARPALPSAAPYAEAAGLTDAERQRLRARRVERKAALRRWEAERAARAAVPFGVGDWVHHEGFGMVGQVQRIDAVSAPGAPVLVESTSSTERTVGVASGFTPCRAPDARPPRTAPMAHRR